MKDKLIRLLTVIPAVIMMALINLLIAFSTSGVVLIQLLSSSWGQEHKNISLAIALIIAIGVHAYIVFNHKIRDFIKQGTTPPTRS